MDERIKALRKALGLNQTEFGARIGVVQGTVTGYETGRSVPISAVISAICREFGVNEAWLRTGEGEMFVPMTRDEGIARFAGRVLADKPEAFRKRFVAMLSDLSDDDWAVLERMALSIFDEQKKG